MKRLSVLFTALLVAFAFSVSPSSAQTGSIRIEVVSAGFIVGVQGGSGTLTFKGRRYPLRIGGVSLGATIGASRAVLVGTVRNIRNASDIVGTYAAGQAALAVVGGARSARLSNSRGVELVLRGRQVGLEFSLDLSGMTISMR
jgi:hypothetical protein